MGVFGGATPPRFALGVPSPAGRFPFVQQDYTALSGAIVMPPGSLDSWWRFSKERSQTERGEVIVFGDSTTAGSGPVPTYSWLQRMRDRAVADGYDDGGKGITATTYEGGMGYDSPEVNAEVSSTFTGFPDSVGVASHAWYDDGSGANHTLNLQFRGSCLRLGYHARNTVGTFTYSLDGAAAVSVDAFQSSSNEARFVYFSGLNPATVHTLQIINTAAPAHVYVNITPMYDTGVVFQKWARSGHTFGNIFYERQPAAPFTQSFDGQWYQQPMGLVSTNVGAPTFGGAPVDTTPAAAARVKPVLAITHLGFNDLTSQNALGLDYWTYYVRRFAAACRDANVSGLVLSGQLPYNSEWPTYGPDRFNILKNEAYAQGLAFADLFYPIGGPSLSYAGGVSNPHLTKTQYQTQADWLWDNLLGLG